jgi:hypothetical protein
MSHDPTDRDPTIRRAIRTYIPERRADRNFA